MYSPQPFSITDPHTILDFINQNPFATLISSTSAFPVATHVPLLSDDSTADIQLIGHMARANKQVVELRANPNVLVIFQGPHHYISSYAKDPENLSILPTWDYQIVHLNGSLEFVDEDTLADSLHLLMRVMEKNEPKALNLNDYPQDTFKKKLKAIIGFRIKVTEAIGCFRLNQNRTPEERKNILDHLKNYGNTEPLIASIKKFNSD